MAALRTPKLLLLDEHTAALDPKTAQKVLELSPGEAEAFRYFGFPPVCSVFSALNSQKNRDFL